MPCSPFRANEQTTLRRREKTAGEPIGTRSRSTAFHDEWVALRVAARRAEFDELRTPARDFAATPELALAVAALVVPVVRPNQPAAVVSRFRTPTPGARPPKGLVNAARPASAAGALGSRAQVRVVGGAVDSARRKTMTRLTGVRAGAIRSCKRRPKTGDRSRRGKGEH